MDRDLATGGEQTYCSKPTFILSFVFDNDRCYRIHLFKAYMRSRRIHRVLSTLTMQQIQRLPVWLLQG